MPRDIATQRQREGRPYLVDTGTVTADHGTIDTRNREGVITSDTTLTVSDTHYGVDTAGGAVTVTLASALVAEGSSVVIKDEGGVAATNAITVATEGSETIDGGTSRTIDSDHGALALYSDGANWFVSSSTAGGGTL